jgi:DNA topoisomerase-2
LAATPLEASDPIDSESNALARQYQKKSDREHVLDTPDTYIGSVESVESDMWVFDRSSDRIIQRTIEYIPGLYKLFDEGIVNCRDHVVRMLQSSALDKKCVSFIETTIGEDGTITFENDGTGIDVAKHPEYDLWIPEMIFGHLRTSTNYDKSEKKIVGGKNGFGFKLALIWSTRGSVETVDHIRGLKYTQEFRNNLSEICPPIITKVAKSVKPYTRVSFTPDYARLGVPGLSADMLALMTKRVYDIGALTDLGTKKLRIGLNGALTPAKNFQQYVDLYLGPKAEAPRVYEAMGERWEYVVAMSPTQQFEQVSFANGICTFKGGADREEEEAGVVQELDQGDPRTHDCVSAVRRGEPEFRQPDQGFPEHAVVGLRVGLRGERRLCGEAGEDRRDGRGVRHLGAQRGEDGQEERRKEDGQCARNTELYGREFRGRREVEGLRAHSV